MIRPLPLLPPLIAVDESDETELKLFMASVIAESVTREEPMLSDFVGNVAGNVDWWLQHPGQGVHLKCTVHGSIVGVVLVKEFWNLSSLFVSPSVQKRGLGRSLLVAAIDHCRGKSPKGAIWLNASPNAVAFYERAGFTARESSQPLPTGFKAMQLQLPA
ncbi:MAG: GNAT family N-acetyltransferase [Ramlibacter sp.]